MCTHTHPNHSSFNLGLLLGLVIGGTVAYFLNQENKPQNHSSSLPNDPDSFLTNKLTTLQNTLARLDSSLSS